MERSPKIYFPIIIKAFVLFNVLLLNSCTSFNEEVSSSSLPLQEFELTTKAVVPSSIKSIALGISHIVMVNEDGLVMGWGENEYGQLGIAKTFNDPFNYQGEPNKNTDQPHILNLTFLNENEKIVQLSAGNRYSLALTSQGRLFSWGMNKFGELGRNFENLTGSSISPATYIPGLIEFSQLNTLEKITKVLAGGYTYRISGSNNNFYEENATSYAITNQGRLFAWGRNDEGQIGDGTTIDRFLPTLITFSSLAVNETIKDIVAGDRYTFVLTTLGRIFGWGNSDYSILGKDVFFARRPTLINIGEFLQLNEVVDMIASGGNFVNLITNQGRVFSWGNNEHGQLGVGPPIVGPNIFSTPQILNFNQLTNAEKPLAIANGFAHSSMITNLGRVFSWGNNEHGQLGNGERKLTGNNGVTTPNVVNFLGLQTNEKIISIHSKYDYSLAITSLNKVYFWGYNASTLMATSQDNQPTWYQLTPFNILVKSNQIIAHLSQEKMVEQSIITLPESPSMGFYIEGWYQNASLTIPFTSEVMPQSNLEIFGKLLPTIR